MESHPSMVKELNSQCKRNDLMICSLLPNEPNQKFDAKLGKMFKSSKW